MKNFILGLAAGGSMLLAVLFGILFFKQRKIIIDESEPEIIYDGFLIIRYEYADGKEGGYLDLSKWDQGYLLFTIYTDYDKAKKVENLIVMMQGDVEYYADGYVALGEKSIQNLMNKKYVIVGPDGIVSAEDIF